MSACVYKGGVRRGLRKNEEKKVSIVTLLSSRYTFNMNMTLYLKFEHSDFASIVFSLDLFTSIFAAQTQ